MSERSFRRENQRRIATEKRRQARLAKRTAAAAVAAGAFALAAPAVSSAATFVVNDTGDTGTTTCDPNDLTAVCQLRDAISKASANPGADQITFDSTITGQTITLNNSYGPLVVNDNYPLTIYGGPSKSSIYIDGNGNQMVFDVQNTYSNGSSPGLTIDGVTIQNGYDDPAGGLYAERYTDVTLSNSRVTGSTANGFRTSPYFGYYCCFFRSSTGIAGGGVANRGSMTISNSEIDNNNSNASYNYYNGTFTMYGGGGVDNLGELTISGSQVHDNYAQGQGGGVFQGSTKYDGHNSGPPGSDIPIDLTITGGTVIGSNGARYAGGAIGSALSLKYANSHNVVQDTTITGNTSGRGAGIGFKYLGAGDHWKVTHSTISANNAYDGRGGGISLGYVGGEFNLEDSTVSGNQAGEGGGVYLDTGAQQQPDAVQFNNSTIASNNAYYDGGGIYREFGYYDAKQPAATGSRAGYYVVNPIPLTSTIVADNNANGSPNDLEDEDPTDGGGFDLSFSLVENTGNSTTTETPAGSNIFGTDPQLGPLQNNGGPTDTQLPSINSPVVDKGKAPARLLTDQRGDPRTVDTSPANAADGTDIGAVELPTGPPAPPSGGSLGTKIHNVKKKHKKRRRIIRTHHNSAKIHLTFNSPIAGATYTCSVDGGPFEPCSSPFSVRLDSAPDPGAKHSITIITRDANGNQLGLPKTFKFRIIRI